MELFLHFFKKVSAFLIQKTIVVFARHSNTFCSFSPGTKHHAPYYFLNSCYLFKITYTVYNRLFHGCHSYFSLLYYFHIWFTLYVAVQHSVILKIVKSFIRCNITLIKHLTSIPKYLKCTVMGNTSIWEQIGTYLITDNTGCFVSMLITT